MGDAARSSRFEPWFDRILVNTCRNRLRSTRRRRPTSPPRSRSRPVITTGRVEDRDVIGAAIAALSPDHQVVVALRFYRDLPVDEIATASRRPARDGPVTPPLRAEAPARRDRSGRQRDSPMTDRELEERLRAWYAAEVGETETAPADLRESLADDPGDDADAPAPAGPAAGLHAAGGRRGPGRRRCAGRWVRGHAPDGRS